MAWHGNLYINKANGGYLLKETLCGKRSEVISLKPICSESSMCLSTYLNYLPTHLYIYIRIHCALREFMSLQTQVLQVSFKVHYIKQSSQVARSAAVSNNGSFSSVNHVFFLHSQCFPSVSHNIHSGLVFRGTDLVTRVVIQGILEG